MSTPAHTQLQICRPRREADETARSCPNDFGYGFKVKKHNSKGEAY